ncbi:MAG: phage tail tape measure protein [Aliihoeflea sp.]|uniref:phage tail tape measure protein n=1 Tax=Aliihoeflea sp. TaxID=2608088 RepID=UPI0040336D86
MATITSRLILQLVDQVTAPARQIQSSVKALTGLGRNMSYGAAVAADVRELGAATREFGQAAGVPAAALAALGGRAVYNLQKVGNTIQAVTGITDEQRASLEEYMRALNKDFPFTNAQIAQAALELARAGLNLEQMRGSLRDTLTLSLAGDIDLGHAADLATNIMTAMRMPMETAEQSATSLRRIVDTLAYSANKSNTTVAMMGETFKYVAPIAAAAGMDIEQVSALSMTLANNGIKASEAGVALRSAIVRMVKPTKPMMAALERMNVNLGEFVTNGRMIASDDIIGSLIGDGIDAEPMRKAIDAVLSDSALQQAPARLAQALTAVISEGLGSDTVVDRSILAATITEAVTAAGSEVDLMGFIRHLRDKGVPLGELMNIFDARQGSRLASLLTSDLHEMLDTIYAEAEGTGARVAETMNKGIVGAWNSTVAGLENIANVMAGTGVLDEVTAMLHRFAGALEALSQSNPSLIYAATWAILATAALVPLGLAASIAGSGLRVLVAALRLITTISLWPTIAALKALGGALSFTSIASALGFASQFAMFGAILKGALAGIGAAVLGITAPIWGVVAAVVAVALAVWNYWVPISAFVSGFASVVWDAMRGAAGAIGEFIAFLASLHLGALINFAALIGIDEETVRGAVAFAISAVTDFAVDVVSTIRGIASSIGSWVSEIFAMNDYTSEAVNGFRSAGEQAGAALVDAIKTAINGLVSWFSGLARRIIAAIGSIDIGSIIKWPQPPAWLSRLWNGGMANVEAPALAGARAAGGPVRAGGSYLVGEEGPEIVTFGRSGMVHDALTTAKVMRNAALASAAMLTPVAAGSPGGSGSSHVEMNIESGAIVIHATQGQSPRQIAEEVERMLSARLNALARGAYSDG